MTDIRRQGVYRTTSGGPSAAMPSPIGSGGKASAPTKWRARPLQFDTYGSEESTTAIAPKRSDRVAGLIEEARNAAERAVTCLDELDPSILESALPKNPFFFVPKDELREAASRILTKLEASIRSLPSDSQLVSHLKTEAGRREVSELIDALGVVGKRIFRLGLHEKPEPTLTKKRMATNHNAVQGIHNVVQELIFQSLKCRNSELNDASCTVQPISVAAETPGIGAPLLANIGRVLLWVHQVLPDSIKPPTEVRIEQAKMRPSFGQGDFPTSGVIEDGVPVLALPVYTGRGGQQTTDWGVLIHEYTHYAARADRLRRIAEATDAEPFIMRAEDLLQQRARANRYKMRAAFPLRFQRCDYLPLTEDQIRKFEIGETQAGETASRLSDELSKHWSACPSGLDEQGGFRVFQVFHHGTYLDEVLCDYVPALLSGDPNIMSRFPGIDEDDAPTRSFCRPVEECSFEPSHHALGRKVRWYLGDKKLGSDQLTRKDNVRRVLDAMYAVLATENSLDEATRAEPIEFLDAVRARFE